MAVKILATCEAALLYPKATTRALPVARSPIAAVATTSVGFTNPAKNRKPKHIQKFCDNPPAMVKQPAVNKPPAINRRRPMLSLSHPKNGEDNARANLMPPNKTPEYKPVLST